MGMARPGKGFSGEDGLEGSAPVVGFCLMKTTSGASDMGMPRFVLAGRMVSGHVFL